MALVTTISLTEGRTTRGRPSRRWGWRCRGRRPTGKLFSSIHFSCPRP